MRCLEILAGRRAEASQHLLAVKRLEAGSARISNEARSPGNAPEEGCDYHLNLTAFFRNY